MVPVSLSRQRQKNFFALYEHHLPRVCASYLKFTIIGAGAVGGYFGSKLQLGGEDVTFLVTERRYSELQKNGLKVKNTEGMSELKVRAVRTVEEIENCEVTIVTVKNYSLNQVLKNIVYLVDCGAKVLTLMNGVEQFEKIRSEVGDKKIVGGVCHLESTLDNGMIIQTGITPQVILGSPSKDGMAYASEVASAFQRAKIKALLSEEIISEVWKKLIFITALSTVTCLTRSPVGPIIENRESRTALGEIVDEIISVGRILGPNLGEGVAGEIMDQIESLPYNMAASMERDLERGRPLEVENLQGYLVRKAEMYDIRVPALTVCYGLLKLKERGNIRKA